jgi:hypothetical protein
MHFHEDYDSMFDYFDCDEATFVCGGFIVTNALSDRIPSDIIKEGDTNPDEVEEFVALYGGEITEN